MKILPFMTALLIALPAALPLSAQGPPKEPVDRDKELLIMDPAVLGSARATTKEGAWHIRTALARIAGYGVDVDKYALDWFKTWSVNVAVPGADDAFVVRPWVEAELKRAWETDKIRLIAIVNRLDLVKFPNGDNSKPPIGLGEGRFVYEVLNEAGDPLPFSIIFEYGLPGLKTYDTVKSWANRWHALGKHQAFDEAYLKDLQKITDEYSATGTLNQIRTNEFLPVPAGQRRLWELREFHSRRLPAVGLVQMPVAVTPAFKFNATEALAKFITDNQAAIVSGKHESVPDALAAAVAPVPVPPAPRTFKWNGGAAPARPAFIVSFNTCNGCHSGDTDTSFQHIGNSATEVLPNGGGKISRFLKGTIDLDHALPEKVQPAKSGETVPHNEMELRADLLRDYLNDPSTSDDPVFRAEIKSRANRVH